MISCTIVQGVFETFIFNILSNIKNKNNIANLVLIFFDKNVYIILFEKIGKNFNQNLNIL